MKRTIIYAVWKLTKPLIRGKNAAECIGVVIAATYPLNRKKATERNCFAEPIGGLDLDETEIQDS